MKINFARYVGELRSSMTLKVLFAQVESQADFRKFYVEYPVESTFDVDSLWHNTWIIIVEAANSDKSSSYYYGALERR